MYFCHPVRLCHMERAAIVAMAAPDTVSGFFLQLVVVTVGQLIPGPCQIVILVNQPYILSCRTGLAVVTVNALSRCVLGSEGVKNGVILLLCCGIQKSEDTP